MATPAGHALAGMLVARRLGVTSGPRLAAAAFAACIPDVDLLVGRALHGDYWSLHRKATHSLAFTLAVGAAGGALGVLGPGRQEGERDVVAGAFTGAAIVTSHLVLDRIYLPYLGTGRRQMPFMRRVRREAANVALDAGLYGALARLLWPPTTSPGLRPFSVQNVPTPPVDSLSD